MYLNQIQPNDSKKLKTLNTYLKENFKMQVDTDSSLTELQTLRECTKSEIHELKYVHGCTSGDSDLGRSLAILEAVDIIIANRRSLKENAFDSEYEDYEDKIEELAKVVAKYVRLGDDLDFAISVAMREYRGSRFLRADYDVERDLREKVKGSLIAAKAEKRRVKEEEVEEGGDFYHPDTNHGSTNYHNKSKAKSASPAAKDVPTVYSQRGTKASFAPKDSGRETTLATPRRKLNMSEDKYICLADNPKLSYNPDTMKGNCVALTGMETNGQDVSYPVRVRFIIGESAKRISIDSIMDVDGSRTTLELSESVKTALSKNILEELIQKGL